MTAAATAPVDTAAAGWVEGQAAGDTAPVAGPRVRPRSAG